MHKSLRTRLWTGGATLIGVVSFLYPFVNPPRSPIGAGSEKPVLSSEVVPNFAIYTKVIDKKMAFFQYLMPEIVRQNERILSERNFIVALQNQWETENRDETVLNSIQQQRIKVLARKYYVDYTGLSDRFFERLLVKVDVIPYELVLVQAANESAWGTSRFAREGFNFFGMWCFKKGCGFVPRRRDEDRDHEVEKFQNLSQGVAKYLNTLNRHFAYEDLRYIRAVFRKTQQPITAEMLAEGLLHYSERGQAYVEELQSMIRVNRKYMQPQMESSLAEI